jgi:hypothetical protein
VNRTRPNGVGGDGPRGRLCRRHIGRWPTSIEEYRTLAADDSTLPIAKVILLTYSSWERVSDGAKTERAVLKAKWVANGVRNEVACAHRRIGGRSQCGCRLQVGWRSITTAPQAEARFQAE